MVRNLYLLRHGHAEHGFDMHDKERELTPVGISKLAMVARDLFTNKIMPDKIYCSTAVRTEQTCLIISERIGFPGEVDYLDEIYEAPMQSLLDVLQRTPDEAKEVMLVGHNPGISYLCDFITGKSFSGFSPGDLVRIELELDSWSQLGQATGHKRDLGA